MTSAYVRGERLSRGGMAEVFRAVRRGPDGSEEAVVLKTLLPDFARAPEFLEGFEAEARLLARLDHPGIVRLLDRGERDGAPFMALEYVDGRDLRAALRDARARGGEPSVAASVHLVAEVASALAHAYERPGDGARPLRVVHADVCPANILVARDGRVKLADFGIARTAGTAPRKGAPQGRPPYVSPGQLRGEPADPRDDVFSLGVVLGELLNGRGSMDLRRVAGAAGAPDPAVRPASARDLERALRATPEGDPSLGARDLANFASDAR